MSPHHYPSDLTDQEWQFIEPSLPKPKPGGRPRKWPLREITNAIFYIVRGGCAWRLLPQDFPPWQTVYHYFRAWRRAKIWQKLFDQLRKHTRLQAKRKAQPTAAILDSQSVKTTEKGGLHGYDGAKKVNGRKRHLLVDTLGLPLIIKVQAADVMDRTGAKVVLQQARRKFPILEHIWADGGYKGALIAWAQEKLKLTLEIVRHPWAEARRGLWWPDDQPLPIIPKGFVVLPRRWVVERTFAWLGRYRRLSKDYEFLPATSETMIQLASSRLMLTRLSRLA